MTIKNILNEILIEFQKGKIIIDGEDYNLHLNVLIEGEKSKIHNERYESLVIKDFDSFSKLVDTYTKLELQNRENIPRYLSENDKVKLIVMYLFINASSEDLCNIEKYVKRKIISIGANTLSDYIEESVYEDYIITSKNEKQSLYMETLNKLSTSISKDGETYYFPEISYEIINNTCYIYSIIASKKNKEKNSTSKYINRKLYSLNSGVLGSESEEYINYKNGSSDYYPENISDVSPSAVASLAIFLKILEKHNITKIKTVPYLPLREQSRQNAIENQQNEEKKRLMQERNEMITTNSIDKLIRTVNRVIYHSDELKVISYPYEYDEALNLEITGEITYNNELLSDLAGAKNRVK